jgi:hypothetical protein
VTFFWVVSDFISSRGGSFSLDKDVISSIDEDKLHKKAGSDDQSVSNAALWLLLLHRLTTVTTDERLELRNSMYFPSPRLVQRLTTSRCNSYPTEDI